MYKYKKMTIPYAKEISSWRYNGHMKSIYMEPYFTNYNPITKEMKGPGQCDGFAVFKDDKLCGLFEYYISDKVEIGLALNPVLVGTGISTDFILEGIKFGIRYYNLTINSVNLSVDKNNVRARFAYLKAGFVIVDQNEEEYLMSYNLNNLSK